MSRLARRMVESPGSPERRDFANFFVDREVLADPPFGHAWCQHT